MIKPYIHPFTFKILKKFLNDNIIVFLGCPISSLMFLTRNENLFMLGFCTCVCLFFFIIYQFVRNAKQGEKRSDILVIPLDAHNLFKHHFLKKFLFLSQYSLLLISCLFFLCYAGEKETPLSLLNILSFISISFSLAYIISCFLTFDSMKMTIEKKQDRLRFFIVGSRSYSVIMIIVMSIFPIILFFKYPLYLFIYLLFFSGASYLVCKKILFPLIFNEQSYWNSLRFNFFYELPVLAVMFLIVFGDMIFKDPKALQNTSTQKVLK